jgi:hypothetical protein
MDYAIGVAWGLTLLIGLVLLPDRFPDRRLLIDAWIVRLVVALGAMLPYEGHYDFLDAYTFFQQGRMAPSAWPVVFGDGSGLVTRLVHVHQTWFLDSYHATKVSFAFVGLAGAVLSIYAADRLLGEKSSIARGLFVFWPSFVFWSSILGKEPLMLLAVGMFLLGTIAWMNDHRARYLALAVAGATLGAGVRTWLAPLFVISLLVAILSRVRRLRLAPTVVLTSLFSAGAYVVVSMVLQRLGVSSLDDLIRSLAVVSQSWAENGGSGQQIPIDITSLYGLLRFIPLGAFTALFRPLPGDVLNAFGLMASAENAIILAAFVAFVGRRIWVGEPLSRGQAVRAAVLAAFILGWSVLYAAVSYQNLGTASRFRLQIVPALGLLLLALAPLRWRSALDERVASLVPW